jgi:sialic acid synthase SpsE
VPLYKIASLESNYVQLLERVGQCGKPVIISRGLTPPTEIRQAVDILKKAGAPSVAVLHCVSAYPAVPEQMNLRTIPDISLRFGVVSGLSDHSLAPSVPLTAVALGASIIEKHLTLRRSDGGPDAAFSLEPDELKALVDEVRTVEVTMGRPSYEFSESEAENGIFRRSIMVVRDIEEGEVFTEENLRVIRPGFGLPPKELSQILGKPASQGCKRGTPLSWDEVKKPAKVEK